MPKMIAIGGGGFTHEADPALDDFVLAQSSARHPELGFIGATSDDNPQKIERFYRRFTGLVRAINHLPKTAPLDAAREWITAQDIIYVGGGNTARMLEDWRASGLAEALGEAALTGTLLAGVSAGAVCWFDFALSDSGGAGLRPLAGLGLTPGSCCPHYSTEPHRRSAFRDHIADGQLPDGIAIDDGVAVLISPGRPPVTFSARAGAAAYSVRRIELAKRSPCHWPQRASAASVRLGFLRQPITNRSNLAAGACIWTGQQEE